MDIIDNPNEITIRWMNSAFSIPKDKLINIDLVLELIDFLNINLENEYQRGYDDGYDDTDY